MLLIVNLLGLKTALESDVVLDKMVDLRLSRRVSTIFWPADATRLPFAMARF
ncbi:hypothetical protein Pgy4_10800 [Pseudomonas savastanoi pv. glycinea str. race 4]|uniref:Uncharacterized protein n=1 Tax=Pseudomonas savastanoi pv. glycinea str. race 4 TaxID=875330 RepID=F3C3K2_PSESG|nr:hypothetical protein Pgy4_10800 [Pseudomonas savastanoi pv. glycinea str. race 4]